MLEKMLPGMLRAREVSVSKGNSPQVRQITAEPPRHLVPTGQTNIWPFNSPERLACTGHPIINRKNFQGENLSGLFISEELWNNGLESVVVITWEANCYFSWWSWLFEAWDEKKYPSPSTERCELPQGRSGGRAFVLFGAFFFFSSAAMTAATAAAICFCNCSSKASG